MLITATPYLLAFAVMLVVFTIIASFISLIIGVTHDNDLLIGFLMLCVFAVGLSHIKTKK